MSLIRIYKKMKHWNLEIIGYWEIRAGCYLERTCNLTPVLQIVQKTTENCSLWLYISTDEIWWLNELWFKRYIQKCTLSRVLILVITSQIWWIMGCLKIKYNFSTKWTNFYHIRWHISEKILFISEGNLSFQNLGRHNLVNKNYNTHTCPITHEVKTTRQTQSVNRIKNIYFSSKIIQKMRQED